MSLEPKRILVPTDFSVASDRAVKMGMTLAERFDAEVHPLYVRQIHVHPGGFFIAPPREQSLLDEVEKVLQSTDLEAREALAGLVPKHNGVRYEGHIETGVSVPNVILESVQSYDCDLIIMGTHGRRAVSRLLMGSVAERIARRSAVPVFTTRDGVAGPLPPKKMLVGYDSSEDSMDALRFAGAWARSPDAKLIVLHVVEPLVYPRFYAYPPTQREYDERIMEKGRQALQQVATEFLPEVEYETAVVQGPAASSIVEYAGKHDCDLVVLATHGLSGFEHALLGSVAERVVRTADVPVLTVRA